jgi:internalin A
MIPVYSKDGFLFFKEKEAPDSILGDRLIIESGKILESVNYINDNDIKSVVINSNYVSLSDLSFFDKITSIEGIYLLAENLDISNINNLKKLRVLRLNNSTEEIDLKNFSELEVLSYSDKNRIKGINYCKNLFWLWVEGYKKEDLTEFKDLVELKYLNLSFSSIKNIHGIENMSKLKYLRLDTMRCLESLRGLSENLNKLEVLDIYNAKKLSNYEDVSMLKSLRQLELGKTGETYSISFIKSLQKLKRVGIGFKVLDGDMSYLKGIESVGFIYYPHYNHKMKDFS